MRREIRQRLKATEHTLYIIQYIYIIYYGQIPQITYCIFLTNSNRTKDFYLSNSMRSKYLNGGACAGSDANEILLFVKGFWFYRPSCSNVPIDLPYTECTTTFLLKPGNEAQ